MSFLLTADQAAQTPTLAAVPASDRGECLDDVARVVATVQHTALLTPERAAARGDMSVDRARRATRVAVELGLLLELPEAVPLPGTPVPPMVLEEMPVETVLRPMAQVLDIEGRSSMDKAELIDAIRSTGTGAQATSADSDATVAS